VRQALNYALNVPDLIKTVAGEAALPLTGPLPSGFDPETPGYTYDPRRARDLLHQAGCGPTLGITLDVPTTLPDTELAKRMAESYIGIETPIIEHHDRPAYAERVRARQIHDAACFDSSPLSTFRVLRGALDELTACDLPEASVGSYPLVTRMRDGTRITVDEAFLTPLLQNAIDELEGEEVLASLLLCAGPFQALTSTRPLIRPFQLAAQTLKSLGLSRASLCRPTISATLPVFHRLRARYLVDGGQAGLVAGGTRAPVLGVQSGRPFGPGVRLRGLPARHRAARSSRGAASRAGSGASRRRGARSHAFQEGV